MSLLEMPTTGHSTRPIWTSDARMPIWASPFLRGSQNATFGAGRAWATRRGGAAPFNHKTGFRVADPPILQWIAARPGPGVSHRTTL